MFLPCTSFIPNAKGYPVLSKSMQAFLKSAFKVRFLPLSLPRPSPSSCSDSD